MKSLTDDMNGAYFVYCLITTALFAAILPFLILFSKLTGWYYKGLGERFGLYGNRRFEKKKARPLIWIHAVSLGEVAVAETIIHELKTLRPEYCFIVSTTTAHGKALARKRLDADIPCIYAPLDFVVSSRLALKTIQPDLIAFVETEIWPNWLMTAKHLGIKTVFVNGRISARSIDGYRKLKPLLKSVFLHVDGFSMIRNEDQNRLLQLGAPAAKVQVNGNAKFDPCGFETGETIKRSMTRLYQVLPRQPVIVAGSIRKNEYRVLIDCYKNLLTLQPDVLMVLAPRHLKTIPAIETYLKQQQIHYQFTSDLKRKTAVRTAGVVILDQFGYLRQTYGIATLVFCGGSLAPTGGQNVIEAAAWGIPVIYGPYMDDFMDAKAVLDQTGGGIQVPDAPALESAIRELLSDPEKRRHAGIRAGQAVWQNRGAARAHAAMIIDVLNQGKIHGMYRSYTAVGSATPFVIPFESPSATNA